MTEFVEITLSNVEVPSVVVVSVELFTFHDPDNVEFVIVVVPVVVPIGATVVSASVGI